MNLKMDARKALLAGIALAACLGFSLNAQAQTCTVGNWTDAQNLTDSDTGTQGSSNRRYGGPCGLRVPVDGSANYVWDESPMDEGVYNVRFYAFLDDAGGDPTVLYRALDNTDSARIEVWYNFPNASDLTLRVIDNSGNQDNTFMGLGGGWHSIEFAWQADPSAGVDFILDGTTQSMTVDTDGQSIAEAQLGNVNGASGGTIDFDDYDSRRIDQPGRLLVADADGNGVVDIFDSLALRDELEGTAFAPGQPDCDENGEVDIFDAPCLRDVIN